MPPLNNPRHEVFCIEYRRDLCGRKAYRKAGYKAAGNAADANASRLLRNAKVQARLLELQEEAALLATIDSSRVLMELARIAFADPRRLFRIDGAIKKPCELDDDTAATISAFDTEEITTKGRNPCQLTKVRFVDKVTALVTLGKHLGLFGTRNSSASKTQNQPSYSFVIYAPDNGRDSVTCKDELVPRI